MTVTKSIPVGAPLETLTAEHFQAAGVTTIAAGHAVHDTYTAFLPPLLPVLIEKFALSNAQAGLLSVFMQWPSLLQPFFGYLADHVNLRYFVICAPAVSAAAMSLLGIAPSYAVMAMLLIVVGVSAAGLHAVGPVITGNLSGRSLGRGMGIWMVGGGLGYTVGPLVIVAALGLVRLEGTPWLMLGGFLASAALFVRLRGVSSRAEQLKEARPWRQALRVIQPVLPAVIGITVVRSFMGSALGTFLPTFLKSEGSELWFAGAALAVFEAAGMAGSLTAGAVSDRWGRRRILAAAMALASPLMVTFLLVHGSARLLALIALGFCALSIMPVMMALLQETFPENRALANGIYLGLSFLANASATLALGVVADGFGLRAAFSLSAILPLLGLPLVWRLPKGTRL